VSINTDQSLGATSRISLRFPITTPITAKGDSLASGWFNAFAQLNIVGNKLLLGARTYAQLPAPTTAPVQSPSGINTSQTATQGSLALVTDSTVTGFGATITVGGGTNVVLAFCDGTNWRVACSAPGAYSTPLTPVLYAWLPASPIKGLIAIVADSTTDTWGTTIAGGGTHVVLAFYDGTNWTVAGGFDNFVEVAVTTYSGLPVSPGVGEIACISDATVNTQNAVVNAGGGTYTALIAHTGLAWRVIGI
jgi:hypothetical protein